MTNPAFMKNSSATWVPPSQCLSTEQGEQIAMIIRGENQENMIKASLNKPSPQTPPEMVGFHLSRVGLMD
jgi:hypothetical protein